MIEVEKWSAILTGEVVTFGNSRHGDLDTKTGTLTLPNATTFAAGASTPDSTLIRFPGLPAASTPSTSETAAGLSWFNDAVAFGRDRRLLPGDPAGLGGQSWLYRSTVGRVWVVSFATTFGSESPVPDPIVAPFTLSVKPFGEFFGDPASWTEIYSGTLSAPRGSVLGTRVSPVIVNPSPDGSRAVAMTGTSVYTTGAAPNNRFDWDYRLGQWRPNEAFEIVLTDAGGTPSVVSVSAVWGAGVPLESLSEKRVTLHSDQTGGDELIAEGTFTRTIVLEARAEEDTNPASTSPNAVWFPKVERLIYAAYDEAGVLQKWTETHEKTFSESFPSLGFSRTETFSGVAGEPCGSGSVYVTRTDATSTGTSGVGYVATLTYTGEVLKNGVPVYSKTITDVRSVSFSFDPGLPLSTGPDYGCCPVGELIGSYIPFEGIGGFSVTLDKIETYIDGVLAVSGEVAGGGTFTTSTELVGHRRGFARNYGGNGATPYAPGSNTAPDAVHHFLFSDHVVGCGVSVVVSPGTSPSSVVSDLMSGPGASTAMPGANISLSLLYTGPTGSANYWATYNHRAPACSYLGTLPI